MNPKRIIITSYMYRNEDAYREIVTEYVKLGIYKIRVNCTRFSNEEYLWQVNQYRKWYGELGITPYIILDFPFPGDKERLFFNSIGKYRINKDELYYIKTERTSSDLDLYFEGDDAEKLYSIGDQLIVGDGEVEFKVQNICETNREIAVRAVNDGAFSLGKSLTNITHPYRKKCTKEKEKLLYRLAEMINPDAIVLSFCESKNDLQEIKSRFNDIEIIPKIESVEGINNLDEILEESNRIMLGRGDFAIQDAMGMGHYQDYIFERANQAHKQVIIATGILNSLSTGSVIPTRAELMDMHYLNRHNDTEVVIAAGCANNTDVINRVVDYVAGV